VSLILMRRSMREKGREFERGTREKGEERGGGNFSHQK